MLNAQHCTIVNSNHAELCKSFPSTNGLREGRATTIRIR